jgi:LmbE family N-acetylglucosaminyl deacetylase
VLTILVLAAHPDDEVLGCGGTIARYAREGHDVHIAILGEGITSRFADRDEAEQAELDHLHGQSRHVADFLGARALSLFGLPDNRFDTVPMLDVVKIIETLVSELRPAVVYTQHGGDLNVDHTVLYRATLTAMRPMAGSPVRDVYAYEVASSTEWAFQQFSPVFTPNVFQDITTTVDTKIEAMQLYETEARPFPHPRSPEALRASARRWGATIGVDAAEAFQLVRSVRTNICLK